MSDDLSAGHIQIIKGLCYMLAQIVGAHRGLHWQTLSLPHDSLHYDDIVCNASR